jgi:hypothetical protein
MDAGSGCFGTVPESNVMSGFFGTLKPAASKMSWDGSDAPRFFFGTLKPAASNGSAEPEGHSPRRSVPAGDCGVDVPHAPSKSSSAIDHSLTSGIKIIR